MKTRILVSYAALAALASVAQAETLNITPDLRLHGPDTGGRAYEAVGHYASGLSFLDVDTTADEKYHQSLLNSSSLTLLQEGIYYNQAETKVGFGEISIARYYDTLGGNPMFVTTLGQDLTLENGYVYAYGVDGETVHGALVSATVMSTDSIYAASVVMTPKWRVPDYVFESGYKPASLKEIETFVREQRHLPGMPSAKEIESKGMDLAEMNLQLLKTVEELTLHVIDLDKMVRVQQAENSRLAEKMEALQARKGGK